MNSVNNLMSFRWIAERVEAGTLVLHAWWFNLTEGQLYAFNPATAASSRSQGVKRRADRRAGTPLSAIKPERFVAALAGRKPAF